MCSLAACVREDCFMRDLDHARMMIRMARKDLKAIEGMADAKTFGDEIFGFHAQQAVEKAIKAWLSCAGVVYPKTHDLALLMATLEDQGETITDDIRSLMDLTDFAVQFRYEAFEDIEEMLDRKHMLQQAASLIERVERRLEETTTET